MDGQATRGRHAMTDIDPESEIRVDVNQDLVSVLLPLDGPVTTKWQRRYDALAKAQGIPATVMPSEPARIIVNLSMPADRSAIEATMDAARALVNKMQADAQAAVAAEGILREWWTRQRA
jgi:hypothetical protein